MRTLPPLWLAPLTAAWLAAFAVGCGSTQFVGSDPDGGDPDGGAPDGGDPDGGVIQPPLPPRCLRADAPLEPDASPLRLNEAMSDNDGAAVDAFGETDDFIELYNTGSAPVDLGAHVVRDGSGAYLRLPSRPLMPGATVILWADGDPEQGPLHLPFKLDADGERIELLRATSCELVDRVDLPALPLSESYARLPDGEGAFEVCRYATAGRENGTRCDPPPPPVLTDGQTFLPFEWPSPWPAPEGNLLMTELALLPASFIEVTNIGATELTLADFTLELAPNRPGTALPIRGEGVVLLWPSATLAPGARVVVPVSPEDTALIAADPAFEGVATLFDATGRPVDRRDFMRWPEGAALTRLGDLARPIYCSDTTPGEGADTCDVVQSRDVGDRVRALQTPGDFEALAAGGAEVGQRAVKFVVDMQASDTVHFIGSERWALHYTWHREVVEGLPPLDRCDPLQAQEFTAGWVAFDALGYTAADTRRYLLGTLVRHASGLNTFEISPGDDISPEQIERAFFDVMGRVEDPTEWALRPIDGDHLGKLRMIEGRVPIVGSNAPFATLQYQPLTQTVGFGELRFVPAAELEQAELGPRVIVITDAVPNDIALVGGLITEAFQTPLAHVNVLSEARGTPNMALRDARNDPRFAPLLGRLVRLDVRPLAPEVREATPEEADAFYAARQPTGPRTVPPIDQSVRGLIELEGARLDVLPLVGAKAAQFAELYRVSTLRPNQFCPPSTLPLSVPRDAFAIPVARYLEHFEDSGARALLEDLLADPEFRVDRAVHEAGLVAVRTAMLEHPVDPTLLSLLTSAIERRFAQERVRLRSSSNTEDLPEFNGAGLHDSVSVELDEVDLPLEDGLRTVWSSLWNTRAYDERELAHIEQLGAAMGVLVHLAHQGEAAQGVAISRNLLDLVRSSQFYINAQIGEASVTNPAPGVVTEQMLYTFPPRAPLIEYQTQSSLTGGSMVLDPDQVRRLGCALGAVHEHFRPLLDPGFENQIFAMQIEWKILRDDTVVVKQARPQPFGHVEIPQDCREF